GSTRHGRRPGRLRSRGAHHRSCGGRSALRERALRRRARTVPCERPPVGAARARLEAAHSVPAEGRRYSPTPVGSFLLLVAIVLVAAWAVARAVGGYGPPDPRLRQLSPREARFFAAPAAAVFPPGGPIPPPGSGAGAVAHLDGWLALLPRRNRILIRLLVAFFEHATLVFPAPGRGGRRRFTALSPAQRIALLDAWSRSRLRVRRLVFASLRTLLTSAYFAN